MDEFFDAELPFVDAHEDIFDSDLDGTPLYYFDPSMKGGEKNLLGKAFHVSLDFTKIPGIMQDEPQFVREGYVNRVLSELDDKTLFGRDQPFDTFAYALHTIRKLRD